MRKLAETILPTRYGTFDMIAYDSGVQDFPHLALVNLEARYDNEIVAVRVHSECMTGDVFGSVRCECGEQLELAMAYLGRHGGVLVYLRQEGRGIGLINKMQAYNLQDQGFNTKEANEHLGFHSDPRDYTIAVEMLKNLGIHRIRLMTNNPSKIHSFAGSHIDIVDRIPIEIPPRKENIGYLRTKKEIMGHMLTSLTTTSLKSH